MTGARGWFAPSDCLRSVREPGTLVAGHESVSDLRRLCTILRNFTCPKAIYSGLYPTRLPATPRSKVGHRRMFDSLVVVTAKKVRTEIEAVRQQ